MFLEETIKSITTYFGNILFFQNKILVRYLDDNSPNYLRTPSKVYYDEATVKHNIFAPQINPPRRKSMFTIVVYENFNCFGVCFMQKVSINLIICTHNFLKL
jgi:hypothetical protein